MPCEGGRTGRLGACVGTAFRGSDVRAAWLVGPAEMRHKPARTRRAVRSMQAFTKLTAIAASLPMVNIDTDKIIPARHLKTIQRTGLGVHLFETLRYDESGAERPEFVLN